MSYSLVQAILPVARRCNMEVNWRIFAIVTVAGWGLIVLQGFAAYKDGFFSAEQLRGMLWLPHYKGGPYAFTEHGGMWIDFFVMTPLLAFVIATYRLPYFSLWGLVELAIAVAITVALVKMWQGFGHFYPEAHAHDPRGPYDPALPIAGWVHGFYMAIVIWICVMYYTVADPRPGFDMMLVSLGLNAVLTLGVMKFNPGWHWDKGAVMQVASLCVVVWAVTGWKLLR